MSVFDLIDGKIRYCFIYQKCANSWCLGTTLLNVKCKYYFRKKHEILALNQLSNKIRVFL